MRADEIREHWRVTGRYPPELVGDFALLEIAAQLAELNDRLKLLTSAGNELAVRTFGK